MTLPQRLAIAGTALLAMSAAVVVAAYLLIFSASQDRAAHAAPVDTAVYLTAYLQPSTGQQMNLAELLGHVPGFADEANLDQKIHDIAQRLLGQLGVDYEADVRPWLGDQVSVAIAADPNRLAAGRMLLLVGVRDALEARAAVRRVVATQPANPPLVDDAGVEIMVSADAAYAVLDDLLVIGQDADAVRAALDADAGRAPSLAGSSRFRDAARRVPADHLAAIYVDTQALGPAREELSGYGTAELALVVERDALRIVGSAPFDAGAASDGGRRQFALASEPSSLADWMPPGTEVEAVVFGVAQTLQDLEAEIGRTPGLEGAADALNQLRALAALGLGISLDDDLLPLLDREVAVAIQDVAGDPVRGQLLLRPSDPVGAAAALARISDALANRGATVTGQEVAGTTVTSVRVPEIGSVSWALLDGVLLIGFAPEDVEAALVAHESGASLSLSVPYRDAWMRLGARAGNELYLDGSAAVDLLSTVISLPSDGRDILHAISSLAITLPARDQNTEIHLILTAR